MNVIGKFYEEDVLPFINKIRKSKPFINEKYFLESILKDTGKNIEKGDFGFILGTMNPMMEYGIKGMFSASIVDGFRIWKRIVEKEEAEKGYIYIHTKSKIIRPDSFKDSYKQIVDFLNEDK